MKKIISLLVLLTFYVAAFSQTTKTVTTVSKTNPHIKVFEQALGTGDVNTAIIALNYYITEQGTNTTYTDSLAMMYLERGSFAQCYYWADLRSKTKPDDAGLMEMKGICLEKLQQPKEAIAIFEKLFATSKSPFHGYKLMELQYSIKRLAECLATANATEKLQFAK